MAPYELATQPHIHSDGRKENRKRKLFLIVGSKYTLHLVDIENVLELSCDPS